MTHMLAMEKQVLLKPLLELRAAPGMSPQFGAGEGEKRMRTGSGKYQGVCMPLGAKREAKKKLGIESRLLGPSK